MRQSQLGKSVGRRLGILFFLVGSTFFSDAAEAPSHFEQANRFYEEGKFTEAISLYESMLKAGLHSPAVFFNLGNACFKKGNPGEALFYYRNGERLAPRDPDIQANLRFVREKVPGSISVAGQAWERPFRYFTLNELSTACAILFWVWAGLISVIRFRPPLAERLRGFTLTSGALLAAGLVVLVLAYLVSSGSVAVVTSKQATIHLGPLAESQPAFTAAEGSELRLTARRDSWVQVLDRSNRSGWISVTNVLVFPPETAR